MSAGVTHRTLDMATDKAIGELFLPATGGTPHPGVLMFGGSEGGVAMTFAAALLASHGYPVLALGYFGVPGLPSTLRDIPLEYFVAAAHMLSAQPVVVEGYSRGSEAALLLAQYYPGLVRGSILYAPNDAVFGAFPGPGDAWTNGGVAIPHTVIPVTNVAGPVLAIAGDDDALWGSVPQARQIMHNLDVAHVAAAHQALIYPGAGHLVGTFPYLPMGTTFVSRVTGATISHGGTQAADEAARSDGWPRVLSWLATLTMR
jgi:dienelactone hydrolase